MSSLQERHALRFADLDYAHRLDDVWENNPYSVGELHSAIRENLLFELGHLQVPSKSRLLRGPGGSGKTHLLGTLRQALGDAPSGTTLGDTTFILVDMTDVAHFWHTLLLGYLESLHKSIHGKDSSLLQLDRVLQALLKKAGSRSTYFQEELEKSSSETFLPLSGEFLSVLHRIHRAEVGQHHHVLQAFLAMGSGDFEISHAGYTWLLGEPLDERRLKLLDIPPGVQEPLDILRGLGWIVSLGGNCLLCLDQIDAIVAQGALYSREEEIPPEELREEEQKAQSIILNLASGLAALQDQTCRTLVLVSCLEMSFQTLRKYALTSLMDRFSESFTLNTVPTGEVAKNIIARRMARAWEAQEGHPPYPTWPFAPQAFDGIEGLFTPREILQHCQKHRLHCLQNDTLEELLSFGVSPEPPKPSSQETPTTPKAKTSSSPSGFSALDRRFGELEKILDMAPLFEEDQEDELGTLLRLGAKLLLWETPIQRNVDLELDPLGLSPTDPLHARIRLIFRSEGDREQHYCFRVIQKTNHSAYQSRLAKALTASGIEKELSFRNLTVFRSTPPLDSGEQTQKQNRAFKKAGGRFASLNAREVLVLGILQKMYQERDPYFSGWVKKRHIVCQLECMQAAFPWITHLRSSLKVVENPPRKEPSQSGVGPFQEQKETREHLSTVYETPPEKTLFSKMTRWFFGTQIQESQEPLEKSVRETLDRDETPVKNTRTPEAIQKKILLGKGKAPGEDVFLPLQSFSRHGVVFGGIGAGKTGLMKHLVEEAALWGVPSVVVDSTNDLALLGRLPAQSPHAPKSERAQKEALFRNHVTTRLWTPGLPEGRPLRLPPLPDFHTLKEDLEGMDTAITMAGAALTEEILLKNPVSASQTRILLVKALEILARRGHTTLETLGKILQEAPEDLTGGFKDDAEASRALGNIVLGMGESETLEESKEPVWSLETLLGSPWETPNRTSVAVISLVGMETLELRRNFLNRLAMNLFSWAHTPVTQGVSELRCLLVLNGAQHYMPWGEDSSCKEILLHLAAAGTRKGLGLMVSSDHGAEMDGMALAQFHTRFMGRSQSPRTVEESKKFLQERGLPQGNVARLPKGTFYLCSESLEGLPREVIPSPCLSYHREENNLTKEDIISLGKSSE